MSRVHHLLLAFCLPACAAGANTPTSSSDEGGASTAAEATGAGGGVGGVSNGGATSASGTASGSGSGGAGTGGQGEGGQGDGGAGVGGNTGGAGGAGAGGAGVGVGGAGVGGGVGTSTGSGSTPVDCGACTKSVVGACSSGAVVVGHYEGGSRTVCIQDGAGTFDLALMSYETTDWTLVGAVNRIDTLQIYTYDAFGSVNGNGGITTDIQQGGNVPANPYAYAGSMGDCPAHTGYAGQVFGTAQGNVCHQELGLGSECSYPNYACLEIAP